MAKHPKTWQEKVGVWFSLCRAELALSLPPPAAQSWCYRREREAKWAQKVLESLRTAAPKGQFGGRGVERFISLGQMEGASEREVQR